MDCFNVHGTHVSWGSSRFNFINEEMRPKGILSWPLKLTPPKKRKKEERRKEEGGEENRI
jgi:hypothetical protein